MSKMITSHIHFYNENLHTPGHESTLGSFSKVEAKRLIDDANTISLMTQTQFLRIALVIPGS